MDRYWENFKIAAKLGVPDQVPLGLIVDSPWLATHAGMHTVDFFVHPDRWFKAHRDLMVRYPEVVWLPGFWVEYGMLAEPSAFGVRVHWHDNRPPSLEPLITSAEYWAEAPIPDVQEDGMMPLILRLYKYAEERLQAEGLGIKMVAARGPMVTAGWVMGITELMTGIIEKPKVINAFLEKITTLLIDWLHAQLDTLKNPDSIMLLDDIVGMVSEEHYHNLVEPHLQRIFNEFDGLVRVYHNDTPCPHLFDAFTRANFDVFNFTYEVDLLETKKKIGHRIALLGNIPPLQIATRQPPEVVYDWAKNCLDRAAPGGGFILSVGGGISPGMPGESIDAMIAAIRDWKAPANPELVEPLHLDLAPLGSGRAGSRRHHRRG